MNKSIWAKIFGWLGSALITLGTTGGLGKYSVLGTILGGLLTGTGIHQASQTSAGHPNG